MKTSISEIKINLLILYYFKLECFLVFALFSLYSRVKKVRKRSWSIIQKRSRWRRKTFGLTCGTFFVSALFMTFWFIHSLFILCIRCRLFESTLLFIFFFELKQSICEKYSQWHKYFHALSLLIEYPSIATVDNIAKNWFLHNF